MELIAIDRSGEPEEALALDAFSRGACFATARNYARTGFAPPWIGYLAVEEGCVVGTCTFRAPPEHGRVEIGYHTSPDHEGKGIATRMAKMLVALAHESDPSLTLFARTKAPENASTKVLQRAGFVAAGPRSDVEDGVAWEWELEPPARERASPSSSLLDRIADGRTDLVFEAVECGVAPSASVRGARLVEWCAYYGDVSALRFLLARGASLDALGPDALNGAAFHGHWRLAEFLLEHGADADRALEDTGETPLHSAFTKAQRPAHELVARVLLAHGADPNRATKPGVETGAFMRDARTRGETPLHRAAAFASAEAIRRLIDAGAKVDTRDAHGETPLAWASWHLRPDAVLRLLLHGPHRLHEERDSTYDHGAGIGAMERALLGTPACERRGREDVEA
ncbi:MAG: GNAT family N-acetyltransferase [Planctomycetes bacterium]|nr:GNAT family N-acetyltransferase [Planctomycetota bacterium]